MKAVSRPGDLGRRVALRRRELGLSVAELAERAGMAPAFVEYVESRPADLLVRIRPALITGRVLRTGPAGKAEGAA